MVSIAINGFGRVGRCFLRAVHNMVRVSSINCTMSAEKCAHFLKWDSVHGPFSKQVVSLQGGISIDGGPEIRVTNHPKPGSITDADIVVECSGQFNKKSQAEAHLTNGVRTVLISAPSDSKTIIYGVNHSNINSDDRIISIGSCTSNCLVPMVEILDKEFGILSGFFVTVHAYTNDQRILDANHDDWRRARAGGLSMIPTSTGASKVVGEIFPHLRDSLRGSALRVPVADVSLVDFTFCTHKNVSKDVLNNCFLNSNSKVLSCTQEPLVSVDFVGNSSSAIVDLSETICITDNQARILAWYDNEWGFVERMVDTLMFVIKVHF